MFVQLHVMKDYSASLPNRGLDGLAKRATFGDAERQRISSQCLKASLRGNQPFVSFIDGHEVNDDMPSFAQRLGIGMSLRSRHVFDSFVLPALTRSIGDEDEAKEWSRALADLFLKEASEKPKKISEEDYARGYMAQPIVIGTKEAEAIISAVPVFKGAGITPDGKKGSLRTLFEGRNGPRKTAREFGKTSRLSEADITQLEQKLDDAVNNIRSVCAHAGMDGALFGRMATGSVISRVESCVHVAHALTVHAIQATADYFSVQDTLKDEDDPGASHTNHSEIASGLFYQYAVIDLRQMTTNFACLTPDQQAEIVAWVVRAVYTSECSAKRGSTAGYGAGLYYLAEVGNRQPRTLASAFQKALSLKGENPLWLRAVSELDKHRIHMNELGGAPLFTYDTEQPKIRESSRSTNRGAVEVIADQVKADVLSWLKEQRQAAEPVSLAAE